LNEPAIDAPAQAVILVGGLGTRLGYALCMAWWSTAGILHAFAVGPGAQFREHVEAADAGKLDVEQRRVGRAAARALEAFLAALDGRHLVAVVAEDVGEQPAALLVVLHDQYALRHCASYAVILGNRAVKRDPRPGSLATMSVPP